VKKAKSYQMEGKRWIVDMDLKQFFDEVDHDILMSRLGRKVKDKRIKRLINAILKAGVRDGDRQFSTPKGTPQGGPSLRFCPTFSWTNWTRSLNAGGITSCAMLMTATFMSGVAGPENGYCNPLRDLSKPD